MNAKRVIITGRVQGVGYRDWLMQQAVQLCVSGWVRNRMDGSVEALFAGEVATVEELLRLCRVGPTLAQVEGIVEEPAEAPPAPGFMRRATV